MSSILKAGCSAARENGEAVLLEGLGGEACVNRMKLIGYEPGVWLRAQEKVVGVAMR